MTFQELQQLDLEVHVEKHTEYHLQPRTTNQQQNVNPFNLVNLPWIPELTTYLSYKLYQNHCLIKTSPNAVALCAYLNQLERSWYFVTTLFNYLFIFIIIYALDTYQLYQAWGLTWNHAYKRIVQYQSNKYQNPDVQAFGQATDITYTKQHPAIHNYYRAHNQYVQAYNRCKQHYDLDHISDLPDDRLKDLTQVMIQIYQKRIAEYQTNIKIIIWQIQQDKKLDQLGIQAATVESQEYADLKADFLNFIHQQSQLNQSLRPLHFRDQLFARHFAHKFADTPLETYRGYTQRIWKVTKAHQIESYEKLILLLDGYQQIQLFLKNDLKATITPLPANIQTWIHTHHQELETINVTNQNTERDD